MSGTPPKDRSNIDFCLSPSQGEPGHTERTVGGMRRLQKFTALWLLHLTPARSNTVTPTSAAWCEVQDTVVTAWVAHPLGNTGRHLLQPFPTGLNWSFFSLTRCCWSFLGMWVWPDVWAWGVPVTLAGKIGDKYKRPWCCVGTELPSAMRF